MFFANYIGTSFDGLTEPLPPAMALFPTRMASYRMLHIHYQKVVNLQDRDNNGPPAYHVFQNPTTVPRSSRRLLPISGALPGLVRGCCSILLQTLSPLSWVCKFSFNLLLFITKKASLWLTLTLPQYCVGRRSQPTKTTKRASPRTPLRREAKPTNKNN
ncbi:hypothetical protein F5Y09DRAFT_323440 [Xylaria sp. FL1042]|nr:hypothetical protein F5Y09DRAFT_323440 [Xylaria sp. FL1042]